MRVTGTMFVESLTGQLARLTTRQSRLQQQAATGQRVTRPEDDPGSMRRVLDLQAESRAVEQRQRNIASLKEQASVAYGAMSSLQKVSDRAGEIAVLADGTKSPEELRHYAAEVTQLIHQAVQLANTKHRGDYVFAGTRTDQAAFAETTNASGQVTAVAYQGNTSEAEVEVAEGMTVAARIVGANTTGTGARGLFADSAAGADFFNHLIALQNALQAGDPAAVRSNVLPALQRDEDNFLHHIAKNGAVQARLEATDTIASSRLFSVEQLVSAEADADLAQTIVRLNETQNAYRAALQTGGTILNQSLLDYLR